jgi:hypothetical protein
MRASAAPFRPNLGVVMSDVRIWRGLSDRSQNTPSVANHHHHPMPAQPAPLQPCQWAERGGALAADYRVECEGTDGTSIRFDVRGLMEPYDIADPAMDPRSRAGSRRAAGCSVRPIAATGTCIRMC